MAKPLAGIRIADFTVHNAGPFCTHMLAQLGAECIKVESAHRPDIFRKPHPVYGRLGPASFDQVASGKLSVRINLKLPRGIALAKRLVSIWDVAAESFRPGVLARLGLGYDYDVCDAQSILTRMCVEDGRLVLPDGMSYAILALPDQDFMPLPVLEKIGKLVAAGATAVGPKPMRSVGVRGAAAGDEAVRRLADKMSPVPGR